MPHIFLSLMGFLNGLIMGVTAKITILIKDEFRRLRENNQNMCFVSSKEPSHWDSSFKHPKHMFWLRISVVVQIISPISDKNELKMPINWLSKNRYLLSILCLHTSRYCLPGLVFTTGKPPFCQPCLPLLVKCQLYFDFGILTFTIWLTFLD